MKKQVKKAVKKGTMDKGQGTAKKAEKKTEAKPRSGNSAISPGLAALVVPIYSLHEDPANARRHPVRNMETVVASLERFGQQAPVVYVVHKGHARELPRKVVIKGNGVLRAAKSMGWTHLAAVESGLAEQDAKAYAIADNRTGELSEWDADLLAAQLQELDEAEYDIAATGFTDAELQDLLDDNEKDPPALPAERPAPADRKRGPRVMRFTLGQFTFEVARQVYDAWLSAIEAKCGPDADAVIKELKRRLKVS